MASKYDASSILAAKKSWRQHLKQLTTGKISSDYRVGLASTFTVEPILPFLGSELLAQGMSPELICGPYGQIFQACVTPKSFFEVEDLPDAVVMLWRIEDLMGSELDAMLLGDSSHLEVALSKLDDFITALSTFRDAFEGVLIVNTPPFPDGVLNDFSSIALANTSGVFFRTLSNAFYERIGSIDGVLLLDFDNLQRFNGAREIKDVRKWYLYKQPYSEAFLAELGNLACRIITSKVCAPKKCAVLDCDNTLWGGIVGEDGLGGIDLGSEYPGTAYRDFQKLIKLWQSQGILVALLSKNNEEDVWEVFDRHDGMVLKREHLSGWKINWESKAKNIRELAKQLNIGTESFVFFDDNIWEIEQMRNENPEVQSIQIPDDPAGIVQHIKSHNLFEQLEITSEDRVRGMMMCQNRMRQEQQGKMSHEDFLLSLDLRVLVMEAQEEHLERVTQLINRTNQFNLTTIRRTKEDVLALHGSEEHKIFVLYASDKYGDYGLTGVAVLRRDQPKILIDSYLLSCRVLGKDIETAFLRKVCELSAEEGEVEFLGHFIPTQKNVPCASFYEDHGFTHKGGNSWVAGVNQLPAFPNHIAVNEN